MLREAAEKPLVFQGVHQAIGKEGRCYRTIPFRKALSCFPPASSLTVSPCFFITDADSQLLKCVLPEELPRAPGHPPRNWLKAQRMGVQAPCMPVPAHRAPPEPPQSLHQEIKQVPRRSRQGEGIFFPRSSLGRGRSAGAGQESSARGRFSAEPVFTSTDSESKHGARPRAGREHPRAPLPPGAEGSAGTAEHPGHHGGGHASPPRPRPHGRPPGERAPERSRRLELACPGLIRRFSR